MNMGNNSSGDGMLDQYYTKPETARECWEILLGALPVRIDRAKFIEPSAGDGAFFDLLPIRRRIGLDVVPRHSGVREQDFLTWERRSGSRSLQVVVGNPPFGSRGGLAVRFVNKAAEVADTIGFIVPANFRKFSIHKQLNEDLRLIAAKPLPRNSFRRSNGKDYAVNTEFQVWTRLPHGGKNLRQFSPPPIAHRDFLLRQYNNTPEALTAFREPFDFAVPCQGWQDYSRRERDADRCEKNKQWMLLKAAGKRILDRLLRIDYEDLALRTGTSTPGFRKNDLVREYARTYG